MDIKIYTDGGSRNNPGEAACAFVVYKQNKIIHKESKRLGIASNNNAEYQGVVCALEYLKSLAGIMGKSITRVVFVSDSLLMVNQLNGVYKVKNAAIRDFIMKIRILESEIKLPTLYTHVLREKNTEADALVKEALSF